MDICRPVGRAVLGIRLLPSWASPPTDRIPLCCTFPLAPLSPSLAFKVPRRYASLLYKPCLSKNSSPLYLHSFVFFRKSSSTQSQILGSVPHTISQVIDT